MKPIFSLWLSLFAAILMLTATPVSADDDDDKSGTYAVTITNLTRGQSFTPILVSSHQNSVNIFQLGAPASDALATLAEGGDTAPLTALLVSSPKVNEVVTGPGLLDPGKSITINISAGKDYKFLTLAAMLIPTNDAFFAVQGVRLPKGNKTRVVYAPAYDAGSEPNDEVCANIPGPVCGGTGASPGVGGEGFVHIHAGIHGIGGPAPAGLVAADRDWRNPVARISIRRIK